MSIKFFRPKTITLAAALLTVSIYYGNFGEKENSQPNQKTLSEDIGALENFEPKLPALVGQSAQPKPFDVSESTPNRSPAFLPEIEKAEPIESSPDFFQAGKLDLNLRYILEKDPIFLEQNPRLLALIQKGQKVRAEDINVPSGFRVSLRLEPQCSPTPNSVFLMEAMDENARALLESGNPAFVAARTKIGINGNDLAKALQGEACITAAGADLLEEPGAISFHSEPLPSSTNANPYKIMRNAGLVNLFSVMSYSTFGNAVVSLGVIDTGVNTSHPDLRAVASGDRDDYGHGTMVAGTAAAPKNGIGNMGSMPFHVRIRSYKVNEAGKSSAYSSSISNGIMRAAVDKVEVINVSWSGFTQGSYGGAISAAVQRGSVITGSAGNSRLKVNTNVTIKGSLAVGALNATDNGIASYSNYGPGIELFTPGTYMTTMKSGSYALVSGTSFAAPLVGGMALMIKAFAKAHGKSVSPAMVESMIMDTCSIISTSKGYVRKMQPLAIFQRMQRLLL